MLKLALRDIRSTFGRWIALFIITALGMGFMTGLAQAQPSLMYTLRSYVREQHLYDWRVICNVGFDKDSVRDIASARGVKDCEGAIQLDALCVEDGGSDVVMRFHSITETVNRLWLTAGRMPAAPDECLADSKRYTAADLGSRVVLSSGNSADTLENFTSTQYTIVGIADSPLYLHWDRGNTSLGNGTVRNYLYIPEEGFALERYTELYLTLETEAEIYIDSYNRILRITERRFQEYADTRAREEFDRYLAEGGELPDGVSEPEIYLLSRKHNIGYAGFESDSCIVAGIAKVFPLFFFLVAALVCITTVTRMADEQRTQLGILRALGYSRGSVIVKFLLYSELACVLGCLAGFALGTATIPWLIWKVYSMLYHMGPLRYQVDLKLGASAAGGYILISAAAVWFACRRSLRENPAQLLLPKPPRPGKRSLWERFPALWKKLDPSQRVSVRNLLRYKERLCMMVLGIAGATALMITGFGLRDSIRGIPSLQFDTVSLYDYVVTFSKEPDEKTLTDFAVFAEKALSRWSPVYEGSMDLEYEDGVKSVSLIAAESGEALEGLVDFHNGSQALRYPDTGEALICVKLAESLSLSVGDTIFLTDSERNTLELKVCGIFDNYFFNYVFVPLSTFEDQWGAAPQLKTIYASAGAGRDLHETAAQILGLNGVINVTVSRDVKERTEGMLASMNYIVWFAIICSAALSFTILYNLININILERMREIATVKVLGFTRPETAAYVFRENLMLAGIGVLAGLPLGTGLHRFIMNEIKVDLVYFDTKVLPASYLLAVVLTFLFVVTVNRIMTFRIEKIHMAEALKSND